MHGTVPTSACCAGLPTTAGGWALNATVIPNGNPMPFLTIWPSGQQRPNASLISVFQGQTVSSASIIPANRSGSVDVFANRQTQVVREISGYFGR